jgi:Ca2+-binding RTX toxin-like protein
VTTTPSGITNALAGVVSFNVSGVTPGGTTEATLSLPTGLASGSGNAYLRFNYSTNRFEEYVDANGTPLYSFIDSNGDGNVDGVKLTLVDGDPSWDGDGVANGTVVDPGFYGKGDRAFTGTKGRDTLIGNVLANTFSGNNGNDTLSGDLGNDILLGGKGRDLLTGGEGSDQLGGGKDKDRFIYTSIADSRASTATRDTITDFRGGDKIDLSAIDSNTTIDGNQAFAFIKKQAFSGVSGQLRFSNGLLEADINGDRQTDFSLALTGINRLNASSFVL